MRPIYIRRIHIWIQFFVSSIFEHCDKKRKKRMFFSEACYFSIVNLTLCSGCFFFSAKFFTSFFSSFFGSTILNLLMPKEKKKKFIDFHRCLADKFFKNFLFFFCLAFDYSTKHTDRHYNCIMVTTYVLLFVFFFYLKKNSLVKFKNHFFFLPPPPPSVLSFLKVKNLLENTNLLSIK